MDIVLESDVDQHVDDKPTAESRHVKMTALMLDPSDGSLESQRRNRSMEKVASILASMR